MHPERIHTPRARLLRIVRQGVPWKPIPRPQPRLAECTPRSECERDILTVVRDLASGNGKRFTRPMIEKELDRRGMLHGASTIGLAMARMVRVGLLVNAHDHRGYGLEGGA